MKSTPSFQELYADLKAYYDGDHDAFKRFYNCYLIHALKKHGWDENHADQADLAQEVTFFFLNKPAACLKAEHFGLWATIIRNKKIDQIRKKQRERRRLRGEPDPPKPRSPSSKTAEAREAEGEQPQGQPQSQDQVQAQSTPSTLGKASGKAPVNARRSLEDAFIERDSIRRAICALSDGQRIAAIVLFWPTFRELLKHADLDRLSAMSGRDHGALLSILEDPSCSDVERLILLNYPDLPLESVEARRAYEAKTKELRRSVREIERQRGDEQ